MENSGGATASNWTEAVEDFVYQGEIDKAISFLESTVLNLEKELDKELVQDKNGGNSSFSIADQLSTALHDLSQLYSAEGFSLKADETLSRSIQIKHRKGGLCMEKESISDEFADVGVPKNKDTTAGGIAAHEDYQGSSSNLNSDGFPQESCADDDWEAIADRAPEELLPPESLPGVSKLSLEDQRGPSIKRRGRGTFSYKKHGLYSDTLSDEPLIDDDDSEDTSVDHAEDQQKRKLIYGTRHVLVLADMPLSTNTSYLEKLLKKFKDTFVIRWLNDTTALAVFRTPSNALEAMNSIQWPFTVRVLGEEDELLDSIPPKELEPPRQRPQTSARTAQRLIMNSMGIKLPSSSFGSPELRKQEEARKNRIQSRQNMRDDAWGDDADRDQKPK